MAEAYLKKALERFRNTGDLYREGKVRLTLGELMVSSPIRSVRSRASIETDKAVAAFQKLGASRDLTIALEHKASIRELHAQQRL